MANNLLTGVRKSYNYLNFRLNSIYYEKYYTIAASMNYNNNNIKNTNYST